MSDLETFHQWREDGKHLPEFMRDFHDQKDLFETMTLYFNDSERCPISWMDGHQYTIDWFLWFMAAHGYTLQKTRTKREFYDIEKTIKRYMDELRSSPLIPPKQ